MKRLISLGISLTLLIIIYSRIDLRRFAQAITDSNVWLITAGLLMVLPLTLLAAWRLCLLSPSPGAFTFRDANRVILAAAVLNMALPSKAGDFAKAYFLKTYRGLNGPLSVSLVVFEKSCDLVALSAWCVFGLVVYFPASPISRVMLTGAAVGLLVGILLLGSRNLGARVFTLGQRLFRNSTRFSLEGFGRSWEEMHSHFWTGKTRAIQVVATSIAISFVYFVQIWIFILALGAWTPFAANLSIAPFVVLAGLLPLTFAGVGSRDAAVIALYKPFLDLPTAAALGVLVLTRHLLPALVGIRILGSYVPSLRPPRSTGRHENRRACSTALGGVRRWAASVSRRP